MTATPTDTNSQDFSWFDKHPDLPPKYLSRSELERYAECPFMAWAIEQGKCLAENDAMRSGIEAHNIISDAVCNYAEGGEPVRDAIEQGKFCGRADVNADVIDALKRSAYKIDRLLTKQSDGETPRHRDDLMLFDGGEGAKNGQLAYEALPANSKRGPVMVTSELDLLMAGDSEQVVHEYDWKTGRTVWTPTLIKDSFQFKLHALLIFKAFPQVEQVVTRIFMTRFSEITPAYTFKRKYAEDYEALVNAALEQWYKVQSMGVAECWPRPEKCAGCPAISRCKVANGLEVFDAARMAEDPARFVADTEAMKAYVKEREAAQREYVKKNGDIIGDGISYGLAGPKKIAAPRADAYKVY